MKLRAKITTGWNYQKSKSWTAQQLHEAALRDENYLEFLSSQIQQHQISDIYHLDQLFRKNTRGFKPLKNFVATLSEIESDRDLTCHIDVFAYSFLKQAKNFDWILPFEVKNNKEFIETIRNWLGIIRQLENFERFGHDLPQPLANKYLALRQIISRLSVRDEIRTLAILLISGPSTLKEISEDLGLHYSMGVRSIAVFTNIDIVKQSGQIYYIGPEYLPIVIFCIRETVGLDLLSNYNLESEIIDN
mgnify:CR=1 FL=1